MRELKSLNKERKLKGENTSQYPKKITEEYENWLENYFEGGEYEKDHGESLNLSEIITSKDRTLKMNPHLSEFLNEQTQKKSIKKRPDVIQEQLLGRVGHTSSLKHLFNESLYCHIKGFNTYLQVIEGVKNLNSNFYKHNVPVYLVNYNNYLVCIKHSASSIQNIIITLKGYYNKVRVYIKNPDLFDRKIFFF